MIVTGMGVISPAGFSYPSFFQTLLDAKTVYGPIEAYRDDPQHRIKIGARIADESWKAACSDKGLESDGRAAQMAAATACQAMEDAGLHVQQGLRIAVVMGTTMGEIQEEERFCKEYCRGGQEKLHSVAYPSWRIAQAVALAVGAQAGIYTVPAACAAGNYAVGLARLLLNSGQADVVLAGGVDVFSEVAFAGFQRLLSLTADFCRPFDRNRRGLVVGEGCGIVVLERPGSRKGQKRHGMIRGIGLCSNAYHMTAPHAAGTGEAAAMESALKDAGARPEEVGYICAHGTGTRANDRVEAQAVERVFGPKTPPVSSIKSMLGHCMGAASSLELIACLMMLQQGVLLPTMHYQTPDEQCPIDVIPNAPRQKQVDLILSNSFAFGGQTSSVALSR